MAKLRPEPEEFSRKKRKKTKPDQNARAGKIARTDEPEESRTLQRGVSWKSLDLILLLQNKELDLERKIELAFEFVRSVDVGKGQGSEIVQMPHLILFLNDWIQSVLIYSGKKNTVNKKLGSDKEGLCLEPCLDFRCWAVFRFCLKSEFLKLLSFSPNLLRSISCVSGAALSILNSRFVGHESEIPGKELCQFELLSMVSESVSLFFSTHGRTFNSNVDLWASSALAALDLVQKIFTVNFTNDTAGVLLKLSSATLESLSKFLRAHPNPKNVFPVVVEKLLEPLLILIPVLMKVSSSDVRCDQARYFLTIVEDILSNGLFHSAHIDGFLNIWSAEKYASPGVSENETEKDDFHLSKRHAVKQSKSIVKSYHKRLFQKLEQLRAEKKSAALSGVGLLLGLFIRRVKKQIKALAQFKSINTAEKSGVSGNSGSVDMEFKSDSLEGSDEFREIAIEKKKSILEQSVSLSRLDEATSRSLFDLFVMFMEPLVLDIKCYSKTVFPEEGDCSELALSNVYCILEAINKILATLMHEKIYIRTEDTARGAHCNFLKEVYNTIISFAARMPKLWLLVSKRSADNKRINDGNYTKMILAISKEVIVAVEYSFKIEYKVAENHLVDIWLLILSYLAFDFSHSVLVPEILHLGCELISAYSELRQVDNPIFALCKAMRFSTFRNDDGLTGNFLSHASCLSSETCVRSSLTLLCSQEFRASISTAINSVPEGQAAGFIRHLKMDLEESLEWMKITYSRGDGSGREEETNLQSSNKDELKFLAELLGKGLSELYTFILDSLTVTTGNSIPVGNSLKDLILTMRPSLGILVDPQSDGVNVFFSSVTGRRFSTSGCGASWVVLFFLRLYASCRSLYQQLICLMPPVSAKKALATMGNLFIAFSGKDWIERTDWEDEGYFSWIINPSISLPVLIQSVSVMFLKDGSEDCAALIYVFHLMAFQRLVDLNRHIKAFEFLQERDGRSLQVTLLDDAGLHLFRKERKKWKRLISIVRKEASDLISFITQFLHPLFVRKEQFVPLNSVHEHDAWDFIVCSMDKVSLPTAIWWLLCRNLDIWCAHTSKKNLKKFISILFLSSLPCLSEGFGEKSVSQRKVYMYQISLELLSDPVLYEQKFLCRHLTSRFCRILKGSLSSLLLFPSWDFDFKCLPDWLSLISIVEKASMIDIDNGHASTAGTETMRLEGFERQKVFPAISSKLMECRGLLKLLCWMPKASAKSKSSLVYATHILNLEKIVVLCLLDCHCKLYSRSHYELLKLFLSCRRALKYLAVASYEDNLEVKQSSLIPVLFESSYSILWLLKSVSKVVELSCAFSEEEHSRKVKYLIFSLMDHTSHIFLTLSKGQLNIAAKSLIFQEPPCVDLCILGDNSKMDNLLETDAWRNLEILAETLKEEASGLHIALKETVTKSFYPQKLSSLVSAFQGFLWGAASAFCIGEKCTTTKTQPMELRHCLIAKLIFYVDIFEDFVNFCLTMLLLDGTPNAQLDDLIVNLFEPQHLNRSLLQNLLKGESLELGFLFGQFFMASAAILRLKYLLYYPMDHSQLTSSSLALLIGTSHFLLSELAEMVEEPHWFSFVWLEGILKYLEVLGGHFPFMDPVFSRVVYTKLIDIHLRAISKCISLHGKTEALASEETEGGFKKHQAQAGLSGKFKARVRMSLTMFIKKPLELHLLSAVQALERALAGVQEGCNMSYRITVGSLEGGWVSTTVAAGIECLDLVLGSVSGHKRLSVLARHMPNLVGALFNILLHLQSPLMFYRSKFYSSQNEVYAEPGSVILMCVEILSKVAGRNSLFPLDFSHVAQSFHLPTTLFQHFYRLRTSQSGSYSSIFSVNQEVGPLGFYSSGAQPGFIDRQFLVDLYTTCCRLLCTVLRHSKRESGRCIALLEDSVRVLLECLEWIDTDPNGTTSSFVWEVQEGVKCASFLRRIYEEIMQRIVNQQGSDVERAYPHIFWSPCVVHTLNLIFKDLARSFDWLDDTYNSGKNIVKYITNHSQALHIFRSHSKLELLKVAKTRFASHYITLKRIVCVREALRLTIVSDAWRSWADALSNELQRQYGAKVKCDVLFDIFWDSVHLVLTLTKPLYKMIKFTDQEGPLIGEVYEGMDNMLGHIKDNLYGNKKFEKIYKTVQEIVTSRWNKMNVPLYALAYALTPKYYDPAYLAIPAPSGGRRVTPDQDNDVADAVNNAICKISSDDIMVDLLREQFIAFVTKKGRFGMPLALRETRNPKISAFDWWRFHGGDALDLRPMAIKVLSQSISTSSAERVWSTYSYIHNVKRNRLNSSRADSLVYIHSNL